MRKRRLLIYFFLFVVFFAPYLIASQSQGGDINGVENSKDTLSLRKDSIQLDSIPVDSLLSGTLPDSIPQNKRSALDAPVAYSAADSIIFTNGNWGYLYGTSKVDYKDISLAAENITMDMDSSTVHATFGLDSVGSEFGYPVFTDNGTDYESKAMKYNFKSKKGYITHVITQQGEGYIVAERAKKNEDNSIFMCDGKYTTCDHEHPHFYIQMTKAKVRPKKDVVTGPAYFVLLDIPTPIALPFAFFPFSDKYSSGIIMPSYGDEMERGFNLRDGGYYFAINDNVDLALTGEVYTKGSWGLSARSTYKKRYRYSGSFNGSYLVTKLGDKDVPESYSVSKDFRISWTHQQDAKANMYRTLSAQVNFSTSSFNRNDLNSRYNNSFAENTKSSTVNLTQRFPNSPFTISGSMSVTQRTKDSTINLTLPSVNISMQSVYPFKRKSAVGSERWYEKIRVGYSGQFSNSILTKEDKLFQSNLQRDWENTFKHSIPISATFNVFDYLNITPSFSYNEKWFTDKITKRWDSNKKTLVPVDTTYGFNRIYDFSYSLGFQTKLYGMYEPLIGGNTVKAIRHVFTPSISFSGRPDFGDPFFGFYETITYYDANGDQQKYRYALYDGAPSSGKQGNVNFSFENNIEAKVNTGDTTRIISLIDNLGINTSYNMMADSIKWSDIQANIRLKLLKNLTINLSGTFDPYTYKLDSNDKVYRSNTLRIRAGKGIGRLMRTSYSISPSINQDTFRKWFGKDKDKEDDKNTKKKSDDDLLDDEFGEEDAPEEAGPRKSLMNRETEKGDYDEDGYSKSGVKWTLSANYSMSYGYDQTKIHNNGSGYVEYGHKLTHNLGVSGTIQPTKDWNLNFSTSYDFDNKKFADMSFNFTRNLHCWSISGSFRPVGLYRSYYVTLRASSSMLQDLKYEQRGRNSSYDPDWY